MPAKSGLVAMQMEVDAAADLFERDWKLQGSPEIKDHLVGVAPPLRQILLEELIYIDSEYRRRSGHVVHFDEYRSRFPELASDEEWVKLLQAAIDRVEEQGSKPQDAVATRTIELGSGRPQPSLPRQTPQNDAKAPTRIDRYIVVQELPGGGQSKVFRVVDPDLAGELILKKFLPARDINEKAFRSEALTLEKLRQCPGIARIYGAGVNEGQPYIVVEYVQGRNLEQYARANKIDSDRAIEIILELAHGLGAAHRLGISHLDVKPANIVIDSAGRPKLIDFGVARARDVWQNECDPQGLVSGTPAYMPPEQASGQTQLLGPASDVFSLGGVLYFLLTGKPLYDVNDWRLRLQKATACEWNRQALNSAAAPRRLKAICEKALSPRPEDRFPDGNAFAAAVETFQRNRAIGKWPKFVACGTIVLAAIGLMLNSLLASDPMIDFPVDFQARRQPQDWKAVQDVLPSLRQGDEFRVRATLPQGKYAIVFRYDASGATVLREVPPGEPRELDFKYSVPQVASSQTTLVGIITSRRKIDVNQISRPQNWPLLPGTLLQLDSLGPVKYLKQSRDLETDSEVIEDQMKRIRRSLSGRIDGIEAVAFVCGAQHQK